MKNEQYTILIIDDSAEDKALYRRFLEREHRCTYRIVECESGVEALELYQQIMPDMVLLDFLLPDLDGLEILNELKLLCVSKQLPVVILTGQGDEITAVQAMKSGAQDYLIKGKLTVEILCRTIYSIIQRIRLAQQLEQNQKQQELIGAIALRIRQSLDLETNLHTAVHEVRELLAADRVVVYKLTTDMGGRIVAESVLSEWTTCLNVQIEDTCFQDNSSGEYGQGRQNAIANIYEAGLTDCHIKLLERFQVKANLVVPIILNTQESTTIAVDRTPIPCWGLLIAHQCSAPRQWQKTELDLLEQLAVHIAIAIQQAELYESLQTVNKDLRQAKETLEIRVAARTFEILQANERLQRELYERERAERAAQQSQALLGSIMDGTTDQIAALDLELRFIAFNKAYKAEFFKIFGREIEIGTSLIDALTHLPQEQANVVDLWSRALQGEEFTVIQEFGDRTRARNYYEINYNCIWDENNRLIGASHVVRDTSERLRAEAALQESEERLQLALESSGDGLWDWNVTTGSAYLSPRWFEMLGYKVNELPENVSTWKRLIHPEDKSLVIDTLNAHLQDSSFPYAFDYRVLTKSGEWKWIANYGKVVVRDENGLALRMVGTHRDISDRKRTEEKLKMLNAKLEESNQELQNFAFIASHDLKEPLRTMMSFSSLLSCRYEQLLDERGRDYIRRMQKSAQRMQGLIDDLLALSRVTTQAKPFVCVDLNQVVQAVLSTLETRIQETKAQIEVGFLPKLEAESGQLHQLMQNLISNALKFHGHNSPIVKIYSQTSVINSVCQIIVEDQGIGFDEKYLDRIFKIFERLHGRSEYEGTGIGLALCRKISECHGGSITAKSVLGKGSTFIVTLPMKKTIPSP